IARFDMADGKELGRVTLQRFGPRSDLLSADGTVVAHNKISQGVSLVDAVTGKERFNVPRRGTGQAVLGWGTGGQTLVVSTAAGVLILDVATGKEITQWKVTLPKVVLAVAGSPDGTRVAALADSGNVTLHDATTGKVV